MKASKILVIIGGIILLIGARLPWMSIPVLFGVERPAYEGVEIGWEGDGYITGGIGLILLLGGLFLGKWNETKFSLLGSFLAGLALLVIAGDFQRVLEIGPSAGFFAAVDVGLYTTLVGALAALAGELMALREALTNNRNVTQSPV